MKAIILCGGRGERMRPLTDTTPKPMLPIAGKPLLVHQINLLKKAGITDIVMAAFYLVDVIRDYFGDGSKFGVKIDYSIEDAPRGSGGAIKEAQKYLGDDNFVVLSGDVVNRMDLSKFITFHKDNNSTVTLAVHPSSHPEDSDLVEIDEGGKVTKLWLKPHPEDVPTDLGNAGVFVMEPKVFEYIAEDGLIGFEKEILPKLMDDVLPIYGYNTDEYIKDMGTLERYEEIQSKYQTEGWTADNV